MEQRHVTEFFSYLLSCHSFVPLPVSNGKNSLVMKPFPDCLLNQLVSLMINTSGSFIDAQNLEATGSVSYKTMVGNATNTKPF